MLSPPMLCIFTYSVSSEIYRFQDKYYLPKTDKLRNREAIFGRLPQMRFVFHKLICIIITFTHELKDGVVDLLTQVPSNAICKVAFKLTF
jgi:hypothetical protein